MKKDKSTELEGNYWEGISSLEQERNLKEQGSDVYFNGLKEAKAHEMDWTFDDFIAQAQKQKMVKPVLKKWSSLQLWACGAAAVVLLFTGIFYMRSDLGEAVDSRALAHVPMLDSPDHTEERNIKEQPVSDGHTVQENTFVRKSLIGTQAQVPRETEQAVLEVTESESLEEQAYVVVNGQPIYDGDEAEKIALASLQIMVDNFQEGKEALEKVKYIKVEF